MKKIVYGVIILSVFGFLTTSSLAKKKSSSHLKKVSKVLSEYTKKYTPLIKISPAQLSIEFKEKKHQSFLQSNRISQKKFNEKYPQSSGVRGSLAHYLSKQGFKQIKECMEFDPNKESTGFTWKKGRLLIHYTIYSDVEKGTHDFLDVITFFPRDLCGKG